MTLPLSKTLAPIAGAFKGAIVAMAVISGTVNLLALTGSLYMMQVYDRVLSSRSVSTLVALSTLAFGLYVIQALLEIMRTQSLVRIAGRIDRTYMAAAHAAALRFTLLGRRGGTAQQPMRDVDTVRGFLSGQGPVAILDLPWMPLFIGFVFLLHPLLGWITLAGGIALFGLTLWTERRTIAPATALVRATSKRASLIEGHTRNAEVLKAMGFAPRAQARFAQANAELVAEQRRLSDVTSGLSAVSRTLRLILQSLLLGVGAYLVINGQMTAGAIIAASIASARAYAPIETAIAHWKGFVAARQSAERLSTIGESDPAGGADEAQELELPDPVARLSLEDVSVIAPGGQKPVLYNVSLEAKAGEAIAVIGQSAAGKSTMARAMVGVWPLARGTVRLDGADIQHWPDAALGRHIGYLPQNVDLFEGTITDNIARFDENPDSKTVIAAARAAGVHEMILRLPDGYETQLGEGGAALSAGQRQRIALARALYGDPFLVVLDEPNAHLDAEGEEALSEAIKAVRARGGIVVVVAHRSGVLAAVDRVAVLAGGQLTAYGEKNEILRKAVKGAGRSDVATQGEAHSATGNQGRRGS